MMNYPETSRIRLVALKAEEIQLYLREDFSFENHFALEHHHRHVEEIVRKKLSEQIIPKLQSDPANHLFYTLWVAVDKTINTAVAGIVFKGPPNENGEVELGAGTYPGFMNRGYMTETTKLLCEWALKNGVKNIVANCSPENIPSQRTLTKCGFAIVKKEEKNWKWQYRSMV